MNSSGCIWQYEKICEIVHYYINPYPAELNDLNFQQLEDVSRYRDPQL